MQTLSINQIVTYTQNGTHTGTVKQVRHNNYYVIIDNNNPAQLELWDAGYAVGADIHISQIVS